MRLILTGLMGNAGVQRRMVLNGQLIMFDTFLSILMLLYLIVGMF